MGPPFFPFIGRSPSGTASVQYRPDRDFRRYSHFVSGPVPDYRDGHVGKLNVIREILSARITMCRNIKTLHNFKPSATDEEIRASALQFVRKLSGSTRPSKANQIAFDHAVDKVARIARHLLDALVTTAPPRNRDVEAAKARARAVERYRPAPNAAP